MPCKICGESLLIGKKSDNNALWCPKCNGIEVLDKDEMLKGSYEQLKSNSNEKNELLKEYSKKSIIGSLCASLEATSAVGNNFRDICSTSYAIRDILKKKSKVFGYKRIPFTDLQHLHQIYQFEFQEMCINHSLMHDDYVVEIRIPPNKISEFAMNSDDLCQKNEIIRGRFTEDWNFNKLVAIRYGLYSDRELSQEQSGPKQWSQKSIFNNELNRIKYLFQFAAGTSKLSNNLKSNVDLIDEIKQLHEDFFGSFIPTSLEGKKTQGNISPINKDDIIESFSKIVSNPHEIYDKIVNIEFPLIVEIEDLCFVLPNACNFYIQLLYAHKYEDKLIQEKNNWGTLLEELVFHTVKLFGYDVINPLNNETLLNFNVIDENDKINGRGRSFELDVAGFNNDNSVIVECKHWDIGYNFFKRRSIEKRKKELIKELEKFQHKIDLIKKDEKFDFMTKGKQLDAFLVSLHPEPIKQYGSIKVVSFNEFKPRKNKSYLSDISYQEPVFRKTHIFSKRHYKSGNELIGIDFTKMITNPYGINHFCIEPEDEFKSYIYIGDGIVGGFDHVELIIDTPINMQVIIDLVEEDFSYLKSHKIKKGRKVRYQIYTKDPLFSTYYLRFIRRLKD